MTFSTDPFNLHQHRRLLAADLSSLVPVPGQYDNAAYFNASAIAKDQNVPIFGHTEAGRLRPVKGVFTILGPQQRAYTVSGFQTGDIPAPADYLGNGEDQVVAYRPSTGQFIEGTTAGPDDDPRHPRPVGRHPRDRPAVLSPARREHGEHRHDRPAGRRPPATAVRSSSGSSSTTTTGNTGTTTAPATRTPTTGGIDNTGSTSSSTTTTTRPPVRAIRAEPCASAPVTVPTSKHPKKVVTKKAHPRRSRSRRRR